MKRYIHLAASVMLILALGLASAACSEDDTKPTAEETTASETVETTTEATTEATEETASETTAEITEETVTEVTIDVEVNVSSPDYQVTDDMILNAVKNYCYDQNPDLEDIVNEGEYTVYWEVESNDAREAVVLYRSYTGSHSRFYIDTQTWDFYVTEFLPGVTDEERTGEEANLGDYLTDEA